MKSIVIVWNSIFKHADSVVRDICQNPRFEVEGRFDLALSQEQLAGFIRDFYPFSDEEAFKADRKIAALCNPIYGNRISILFLDCKAEKKAWLAAKGKYMYESVLNLKLSLRRKYGLFLETGNSLDDHYNDNTVHMSDDEAEYAHDLPVCLDFILDRALRTDDGYINLDACMAKHTNRSACLEGTREKVWLAGKQLMFKSALPGTWEIEGQLLSSLIAEKIHLRSAKARYEAAVLDGRKGVAATSFIPEGCDYFSMRDIIDPDRKMSNRSLVHSNVIPHLVETIENRFDCVVGIEDDLKALFLFDACTLQADRQPNNLGIVVPSDGSRPYLVSFDDANVFFAYDAESVCRFRKNGECVAELIRANSITCLLDDARMDPFEDRRSLVSRTEGGEALTKMIANNIDLWIAEDEALSGFKYCDEFRDAAISSYRWMTGAKND